MRGGAGQWWTGVSPTCLGACTYSRTRRSAPRPPPAAARELTRGRQVSVDDLRACVSEAGAQVPREQLDALLALDVDQYIGNAREAALAVGSHCSFEGDRL